MKWKSCAQALAFGCIRASRRAEAGNTNSFSRLADLWSSHPDPRPSTIPRRRQSHSLVQYPPLSTTLVSAHCQRLLDISDLHTCGFQLTTIGHVTTVAFIYAQHTRNLHIPRVAFSCTERIQHTDLLIALCCRAVDSGLRCTLSDEPKWGEDKLPRCQRCAQRLATC